MPSTSKQPTNIKPSLTTSGKSSQEGKPDLISVTGHITSPGGRPKFIPGQSTSFPGGNTLSPTPNPTSEPPLNSSDKTTFFANSIPLTQHPLYAKVKTLHDSLHPFLCHDWESNDTYNLTSLKYYNVLLHFNPNTKARPTKLKKILIDMFKTELLPQLAPFCIPPPAPLSSQMETDQEDIDFDPLDRRTTVAMLSDAIRSQSSRVSISSVALKDEVLALYKHYVNPYLAGLKKSTYTRKPNIVSSNRLDKLTTHQIRHALQAHHPEVFVNCPVLKISHYKALYRKFVMDEPKLAKEEDLVEGYHYWIIADLVQEDETDK
ncbi:uncharacterized protein MELLADRAFT_92228 [Melampsora larici-populina 98AG31]|uniref:Uncharacterized protein n=1 Tax=Melampsora larici-populina (strain 98AG31 / pathotype 3-4-7) TaxID=747676 RepID=F4R8W4_MELLP|nr:uncharacterized protein MELLADRAFT_92228 [Melampsora larici-populina 98AG31]EGG10881.1 hypothetical protein MELLADRAFT_92228 [Melampsora larici-populina 98AG31]